VGFATLSELRDGAQANLSPEVWDYLESGAGEEQTLRDNRSAFSAWRFRPRYLNGRGRPDPSTSFLGLDLAMPVLTAPFGADRYFDAEGQCAVVRAAVAFGIASVVPEASSFPLEEIAAAAPAAARIMQVHPTGDEDRFVALAHRAAAAGYGLLCLTLDAPAAGWRERGMRNRFVFELEAIAGNNVPGIPDEEQDVFGSLLDRGEPVWTWEQLRSVAERLPLPWLAKGVLTRHDAEAALAAGAVAIVVSNHGGRQLDGVPATLDQLPEVVEAVAGRVPVALDGGVRRGTDVLKALALGADVVLLGRSAAYGLAADGQAGVRRTLELLHGELVTTMALLGCDRIEQLEPDLLQPAGFRGAGDPGP
jgi:4-hydroxymandelate oxidase